MRKKWLAVITIILSLAGCSYVSQTVLPEHITRINLPPVKNSTFYSGLGEKLTAKLSQELAANSRISLSDEADADAILRVEIYQYLKRATEVDSRGYPREFSVTVIAKVSLFDKINDKIFWNEEHVENSASFTTTLSSLNELTSEAAGVETALNDLASQIAHRVLYGW